jgi:hypothetical protein
LVIHLRVEGTPIVEQGAQGEPAALRWLGAALDALGHRGDARSSWQGALALYTALGMSEADDIRALLAG